MDSNDNSSTVEEYLARVDQINQQQQARVAELIASTQQNIDNLGPVNIPESPAQDQQMEQLYSAVNNELQKAMESLNQQIEAISSNARGAQQGE